MAISWFKPTRNWGLLLLGIWLIATAVLALFPDIGFKHSSVVLAVVALVAGALLILGK